MPPIPGGARPGSSTTLRRTQKPYAARPADRGKPKRAASGFFDGLKNMVSGPLSWLATIGKEGADSDEENHPGGDATTGSKRRSVIQKGQDEMPARKKARRSSPTRMVDQDGSAGVGHYLDPPEVLKVSSKASNIPFPLAKDGPSNAEGVVEPGSDVHSTLIPSLANGGGHESIIPNHSPFKPPVSLPRSRMPSGTSRRTASLSSNGVGRRNSIIRLDAQEIRRPSPALQKAPTGLFASGYLRDGEPSVRPQLNGVFPRVSHSPAAEAIMRSPERSPERPQGPLRMGSALRQSYTPAGGLFKASSPTKQSPTKPLGPLFTRPDLVPLGRRTSSLMQVDQPLARTASGSLIFEPGKGITTVEEIAAEKDIHLPQPRAPRNNAERLLLALEQSRPVDERTKLRMKQKAAVKVPVPGPASLPSKTNRMVNPYARPSPKGKEKEVDLSVSGSSKRPGALRRYLDAGLKAKQEQALQKEISAKENSKDRPSVLTTKEAEDEMIVEAAAEDEDDEMPPPSPTKVDKAVEAKTEEQPEVVEVSRTINMPGRPSSSLRAGRAPTYRSHVPSSRPTNRFSARFLDDDDEEEEPVADEKTSSLTPAELSDWVAKRGGTLEVPAGFSFSFSKPEEDKKEKDVKMDDTVEKEKQRRDELVKQLRGGIVPPVDPLKSLGPASLPKVPTTPFTFAGVTRAAFASPVVTPAQPVVAAPAVPAPTAPSIPAFFSKPADSLAEKPVETVKPNLDIAPKTADGPVSGLPFSFGAPKPSAPVTAPTSTPSFSFPSSVTPSAPSVSFTFGARATTEDTKQSEAKTSEAPRPLFTGFGGFGKPAEVPKSESEPAKEKETEKKDTSPSTFGRSAAPSPSPFSFGGSKADTVAPPSDTEVPKAPSPQPPAIVSLGSTPAPTPTPASETPKPLFSFGTSGQNPFATASTSGTPTPTETKPTFVFGKPSDTKIVESSTTSTAVTSPPSLFGAAPASASTAPNPTPTERPNPFAGVGVTPAKPATSSPFSFGTAEKPASSSPFSFGASTSTATTPAAGKAEATSSPFSFSGTTKPVSNGFGFTFGATPTSTAPAKQITPPPQDMMDEGSPTRDAQPAAAAPTSNGFSFTGTTFNATAPAAAAKPSPFSFNFNTPATNPAGNPFAPASTNGAPANPFAPAVAPTPSSPFGSQPSSPFQSPSLPTQTVLSPVQTAFAFGSPQQATSGFTSAPATVPQFNFSAGNNPPPTPTSASRTIKGLPRRGTGRTGTRR